tara:strand:- start:286 stop:387 length:102 start_codon:yes stop_codon:yes gene_type:complete
MVDELAGSGITPSSYKRFVDFFKSGEKTSIKFL